MKPLFTLTAILLLGIAISFGLALRPSGAPAEPFATPQTDAGVARPHHARAVPMIQPMLKRRATSTATARSAPAPAAAAAPTPVVLDPDVVHSPWAFGAEAIDRLRQGLAVEVPHPNGGWLTLRPRNAQAPRARAAGTAELLLFTANGQPGLVTRKGDRWFGTLRTAQDSFFFENHGTGTLIGNDRQLTGRWVPGHSDMRIPSDG